jgi:CHAT domain-containing protein
MRSSNELHRCKLKDQDCEIVSIKQQLTELTALLVSKQEHYGKIITEKHQQIEEMKTKPAEEHNHQKTEDVVMSEEKPQQDHSDYKTLLATHDHQVSTMHEQIHQLQSLVTDLLSHFKIFSGIKEIVFEDSKISDISE